MDVIYTADYGKNIYGYSQVFIIKIWLNVVELMYKATWSKLIDKQIPLCYSHVCMYISTFLLKQISSHSSTAASIFYILFIHQSWHPNAGLEQVAGAMIITKQWMEWVDGGGRPGAAVANLFCLIMRLVKNLSAVCHIWIQVIDLSAGLHGCPLLFQN